MRANDFFALQELMSSHFPIQRVRIMICFLLELLDVARHRQINQPDNDRLARGRQIAFMICDHCRSIGSYDGVQGLSDLFSIQLHNGGIQDFDLRWEPAIFVNKCSTSRQKSGRSVQVKITGFDSAADFFWHFSIKKLLEVEENQTITRQECV